MAPAKWWGKFAVPAGEELRNQQTTDITFSLKLSNE
jgi:hypothetical protein